MFDYEGGRRDTVDGAAGGEDKPGVVTKTELVTFNRPAVVSMLADIGLMLDETKALVARL